MPEPIGASYEPLESRTIIQFDWKRIFFDIRIALFIIFGIVFVILYCFSIIFSKTALTMILNGKIMIKILGMLILIPLGTMMIFMFVVIIGLILYGFISLYSHIRDNWLIKKEMTREIEMENV